MATTKEAVLNTLVTKFGTKDWFHSVEIEPKFGRDVVLYAKHMSSDILKAVPEKIDEHGVVVHFSAYKEANMDKFADKPATPKVEIVEAAKEDEEVKEVDDLVTKLWALKKICGKESLNNIFYEIHDKEEALTADSEEFPEVRAQLDELYNTLGFDVLFEEIEK